MDGHVTWIAFFVVVFERKKGEDSTYYYGNRQEQATNYTPLSAIIAELLYSLILLVGRLG